MFHAVILALAITGSPILPTHTCKEVTVRVIWYPSHTALQLAYPGKFYPDGVAGFTRYAIGHCECEIHTLKPKVVHGTRTKTVGHELLHCLWGEYHSG